MMALSRELATGCEWQHRSRNRGKSRRRLRKAATGSHRIVTRSVTLRSVAVLPATTMADQELGGFSPKEEGELEDGEISDADSGGSGGPQGGVECVSRPSRYPALRRGEPRRSYSPPPHGYRLKEQTFRSPPPGSMRPPQQQCDGNPRPSFWERSSTVLDRLRYRVGGRGRGSRGAAHKPYWEEERGGRDWGWGRGGAEKTPRNFGINIGNSWREPCTRKFKTFDRSPTRKPTYSKNEASGDESFEALLLKYKQIKLELEHIKKDEKLALGTREENAQEDMKMAETQDQYISENNSIVKDLHADVKFAKQVHKEARGIKHALKDGKHSNRIDLTKQMEIEIIDLTKDCKSVHKEISRVGTKETPAVKKNELKSFQAFEIKPLRQKLTFPIEQNKSETKTNVPIDKPQTVEDGTASLKVNDESEEPSPDLDQEENGASCESNASDFASETLLFEDEEEISELNLRLLALQSASKKWHQKEQEVMKESKEKLTKPKTLQQKMKTSSKTHSAKKVSPSYAAKQALRKQKTKAWLKLQQEKEQERRQKEAEEKRKQVEEEERRKREEEIRKIRDLSNQEEQYNKFMKIVGGKRRTKDKSSDPDLTRSSDKQSTDGAGGIYQYDNYEEVAMDTDSETNSPAASPVRPCLYTECSIEFFNLPTQATLPPTLSVQPVAPVYADGLVSVPLQPPPPPPPLPPEEPEQPPKPPFADEEEEEEMLLREELLKSLMNKRTCKPEDTCSNSGPPSPPIQNCQIVQRVNLSAVNINTVSVARKTNTKILRVPRPKRQVISLPKHKSVVVTLNNDSDSESDLEQSNTNISVFGGLEFMIKEARRTAEASKPKMSPKSEKENDPMRTPEALPEDKKIEYRLLKEEIASREKQRLLKSDKLKTNNSPANSDVEIDGVGRTMVASHVTEAESKHRKHKILLIKDESVLKHLLQQEAKKKESVRLAETKMAKLSEQLQATEKILTANKLFLKKLQEQIHKFQQRVLVKKSLALTYGEELARAKAVASQEIGKRKQEHDHFGPNKIFKFDHSPASSPKKHSAELIALEKKRLQKLEFEYALKIQKLKEAHALKIKELPVENPALEEPSFVLPQPSLHDLTQDKITLDTEENDMDDEILSTSTRERRRSFRESNSFTKPNLKHTDTAPSKESISKPAKKAVDVPELFHGLKIDELKKLHAKAESLRELLIKNLAFTVPPQDKHLCGKEISLNVDTVTAHTKHTEIKPFPFGPYHSPLLVFKSYRFSPYFRTKERLYLSSVSYSNMIEPKKCFCRFDLTGTCNDDDCQWQHMRDCTLSRKELFQDILSYNPALIGCTEKSSEEEITPAAEKYVDRLFGINRDRMSMDQMAVLLVSKVNESTNHTPPHTTWKDKRKWRPKYWRKPVSDSSSSSSDDEESAHKPAKHALHVEQKRNLIALDAVVTPDDVRYFTNETDDISNLEASVLENPNDVQLWIKLAYKYLNQTEGTSSERLDSTLNVMARALEHNRENSEIWCHYLKLFSKRGTKEEVQEMCETAVEYAPSYQIWWTFLNLEISFEGKDYVCGRMLQFLMKSAQSGKISDNLSFQLLETLLLRVHISLFTGRYQNAVALLQNALKSADETILAEQLNVQDRCLAWLAYIHLIEFNALPTSLYDPANSNPSRIVNTKPFRIPWQEPQDIKTSSNMLLAVFEDAICSCSDEALPSDQRIVACLPLYINMIALHQLLERWEAAVGLCETLLASCPANCQLRKALVVVYSKMEQQEKACDVWLTAFKQNPCDAQIFYWMCKFLISQERVDEIPLLMQEFVASFFKGFDAEHGLKLLICYLLNFPMPLDCKAPPYKEGLNEEFLNQQTPYLWLVYCLWQSVGASSGEAVDAFETALGAVMQQDTLENLWMDYLVFTNRKVAGPNNKLQEFKCFTDLVNRCLVTVPTRHPIPFSTADYWTNYEFHNLVIFFYLSCIPKSQHSKTLERFSSMMPNNAGLALRMFQEECLENNDHMLKLQAKMFTYKLPSCTAIWKIAIAVECLLKGQKEVHHLYQRALQKLPLCATLWKDQLLFEASEGGKTDNLRKLVSKCQEVGVSLDELLNLNISSTESRSH
ncbi:zinc finger C3H1 domain-containing protein [Ambystoma mexicanum]|uniref:zinc finger C3H1 domain-containing protein n=1 Tax=Ambystoma mexicanum TaxID=8296 RepID=UPI0037E74298